MIKGEYSRRGDFIKLFCYMFSGTVLLIVGILSLVSGAIPIGGVVLFIAVAMLYKEGLKAIFRLSRNKYPQREVLE